jgi:hypothetical protein
MGIPWRFGAGRAPHSPLGREKVLASSEAALFSAWKRRARQFVLPDLDSDWEWLALAQHHGLATRLLDWTCNPLVAAFFSICHEGDDDSVVWAFRAHRVASPADCDVLEYKGVALYRPTAYAARIVRQDAVFTVHGPPTEPVGERDGELLRIVIRAGYRARLLIELAHYGISHASLFPELGGLSRQINWEARTGRLDKDGRGLREVN